MEDSVNATKNEALEGAKELEQHLDLLATFTPAALGILATASGIYTYLGVTTLLDNTGALSVIAAIAYSTAVSVGIFVFWSYILRLLPSMRSSHGYLGLSFACVVGCLAIVAMSSWLNATALAGAAAIEQHLGKTIENYEEELQKTYDTVMEAQNLESHIQRSADDFSKYAKLEASGTGPSRKGGEGSIYAVLSMKKSELQNIVKSIASKKDFIEEERKKGFKLITKMQTLKSGTGSIERRAVKFSEHSINLSAVITNLRQASSAPMVYRAMDDLSRVIKPKMDGKTEEVQKTQEEVIDEVIQKIRDVANGLKVEAQKIIEKEKPQKASYTSISSADAVIRYADNFYPQWAGAIAIDLLPAVLVFILAITQSVIRNGRLGARLEETMTLSELKVAMKAIESVKGNLKNG